MASKYKNWTTEFDAHLEDQYLLHVCDTNRSDEDKRASKEAYENKHPTLKVDPTLLEMLRLCRRGLLKPTDKKWKQFDVHVIANALRKTSPVMQAIVATNLGAILKRDVRRLRTAHDDTSCPTKAASLAAQIVETRRNIDKCEDKRRQGLHFDEKNYVDPIYQREVDRGRSKYDAKLALVERVRSGLYNLTNQRSRGEELLEHKRQLAEHDIDREPLVLEFSTDDEGGIEDDIPNNQKKYHLSTTWMRKHALIEEVYDDKKSVECRSCQREALERKCCEAWRHLQQDGWTLPPDDFEARARPYNE